MSKVLFIIRLCLRFSGRLVKYLFGVRPIAMYGSQTVEQDDLGLAGAALKDQKLIDLDAREKLRNEFCVVNKCGFANTFASGRVSFSSILHALRIGPGDHVLVPAYTCVVVPNAVKYTGANVEYYDIELDTFGGSLEDAKSKFHSGVKAIVVQHLFGVVSRDILATIEWARENNIKVIEDCAHSLGAQLGDVRVGNFGDAAFFSFEQSKVLSTFNGGVATTNDLELSKGIEEFFQICSEPSEERTHKLLRSFQASYWEQKHKMRDVLADLNYLRFKGDKLVSTTAGEMKGEKPVGYEQRLALPLAQIGLNQLAKLERFNDRRRSKAAEWKQWCLDKGYQVPAELPDSTSVYLRYPVLVPSELKKDDSWARAMGISLGVWFTSQLHPAPDYIEDCPNSIYAVDHMVNLPCL